MIKKWKIDKTGKVVITIVGAALVNLEWHPWWKRGCNYHLRFFITVQKSTLKVSIEPFLLAAVRVVGMLDGLHCGSICYSTLRLHAHHFQCEVSKTWASCFRIFSVRPYFQGVFDSAGNRVLFTAWSVVQFSKRLQQKFLHVHNTNRAQVFRTFKILQTLRRHQDDTSPPLLIWIRWQNHSLLNKDISVIL